MYAYRQNKMAAAGSESQLLPLGKFYVCFQRLLCFTYYQGMETELISMRLLNEVKRWDRDKIQR